MTVLYYVALAGVAASLAYNAAATFACIRFARDAACESSPLPKVPPRVAVLKPLHGVSEHLLTNIQSYLELSYPRVEFIFGVADYNDSAIDVPLALRAPYQFATVVISVGAEPGCSNPKVAKLIRMMERISDKTEIVVLSDADISVDRGHLRRVVGELIERDDAGVVTCAYRARPMGSFASRMEALFVNTDFAPLLMLSEMIEPIRHAMGATIAIRRRVLDAIGGFRAIKDMLADDFHIGRLAAEHGFAVRLSRSIVTVACEQTKFSQFWNHQLRWARTYRTARPASLATIAIHGPFWALLFLLAGRASALGIAALAVVLAARLAMASVVMAKVLKIPELVPEIWLVPLKDLVMTAIYFASLVSNKVLWGGRRFRVTARGIMHEVT